MNGGTGTVTWDGTDTFGNKVSKGMYYYRILAGDDSQTGKLILK
jgi:flagellar hook assembly protein FlgD